MKPEFWNSRYGGKEFIYGKVPNRFFKDQLDRLKPGKLLLPCEGEGRNAVYAASAGWEVEAFDQSREGKRKALELSKEQHVEIRYTLCSVDEFDPCRGRFDAVGLIYCHLPGELREGFYSKVKSALKPGGKLILEAFSKEQLQFNSGGPPYSSLLFDLQELANEMKGLNILHNEKTLIELREGTHHKGPASVIRLTAEKEIKSSRD